MKLPPTFRLLLAASSIAFAVSAHAQLQTYETISNYSGSSQQSILNNRSVGQVFTELLGIQSLTYNFFNNGASTATTLSAVFAEWNGSSTPGTSGISTTVFGRYDVLVDFGEFEVNAFQGVNQNRWTTLHNDFGSYNTFEYTFDFSTLLESVGGVYMLNPTKTYAMILSNSSGATTSFGVGFVSKPEEEEILPTSFTNGYAGIGLNSFSSDYTFSQISVIPSSAVPESSTVAAFLGAALVGGLVTFRLRQRRQQLAPVAIAA